MKTIRLVLFALFLINIFSLNHCREAPLTVEEEKVKNIMSIDETMAQEGGGGLCKTIFKCFTNYFCCGDKCYKNKLEYKGECGTRSSIGSSPSVNWNGEGVQGEDDYNIGRSTDNERLPNIGRNRSNYLWTPARVSSGGGFGPESGFRTRSEGNSGGGGRRRFVGVGGVGFGGVEGSKGRRGGSF